jgi:hypothetical protein
VTDLQEGVIYVSKDFGERNVHKIVVNFFVKIHVNKLLEYVIHVKWVITNIKTIVVSDAMKIVKKMRTMNLCAIPKQDNVKDVK